MVCRKCGKELPLDAEFCGNCGVKCKKKSVSKILIICLLAAACGLLVCFLMTAKKQGIMKNQISLKNVNMTSIYQKSESLGEIDINAENHTPSGRDFTQIWDKSLFYWLEDTDAESTEDNHITECDLSRMTLIRTDNRNQLDFEIYSGSDGTIYKITTIEHLPDGALELTDYYYLNGQPNFVFRRSDSVYTPTYASIDKVGERFYFNQDQMVKWRWIYEPQVVKQWVLAKEDTWYTQWEYQEISEAERAQYDTAEKQILNQAYNIFTAATEKKPVSLLEGYVLDEDGSPISGAEVGIGFMKEASCDVPYAKLLTDENGYYAWVIEDRTKDYYLVFQKENYQELIMEPFIQEKQQAQLMQEDMILFAEEKNEKKTIAIQVKQMVLDADRKDIYDEDEKQMPPLDGALVTVWNGFHHRSAQVLSEAADESGVLELELPKGTYTVEVSKEGFLPVTLNLVVRENQSRTVYCTTKDMGGNESSVIPEWKIVLTWENENENLLDLDGCMFTPEKAAGGNMNYINPLKREDRYGNRYLYDARGQVTCEIICLSELQSGSYKYYVSDYETARNEGAGLKRLGTSGAVVQLYRNGVLVNEFSAPEQDGVIWEVFEIQNGIVIPIQKVYPSAEGKSWWQQDKSMTGVSSNLNRASWMVTDGTWLYFSNPWDKGRLYFCRKDGSELTRISLDELEDDRIVVTGDKIYYTAKDESGIGPGIFSIRTDGSERTLIKGNMQYNENGGTIYLCGADEERLYYWYAPETAGEVGAISFSGETVDIKQGFHVSSLMDTDEERVYYNGGDSLWLDEHKFYSSKKDGSGIQLISEDAVREARIHNGYIFCLKTSADGEEVTLERMNPDGSESMVLSQGRGLHDLRIFEYRLYFSDGEGAVHTIGMSGEDETVLPENLSYAHRLIGEEYYERGASYWPGNYRPGPPIRRYGADGAYLGDLFDPTVFKEKLALEYYSGLLERYVPNALKHTDMGWDANMEFAAVDVNKDGISELFITYAADRARNYVDYFCYEETAGGSSARMIWDGQFADIICYVEDKNQLNMSYYEGWGHDVFATYTVDGIYVDEVTTYTGAPNYESYYSQVYNSYVEHYPKLNFVENSGENRMKYLLNGNGTGFVN